jgi:K+-sensing histidine kinase KdpD
MAASTKPDFAHVESLLRPKTLRSGEVRALREDLTGLLAHDLKTPLAAISMNLDFALAEVQALGSEGLRAALEDCRHANARAIRIVSDMADAARLAVGEYQPTVAEVSPALIIEAAVLKLAAEASERGIRVAWTADDASLEADASLLGRALERLLERALRYARSGSQVTIEHSNTTITIRVERIAEAAADLAGRTLAAHFAEAAVRAQGGVVWVEAEGGALVYRIMFGSDTSR